MKAKASKRFTNLYKIELGAETYLRTYDMKYADRSVVHRKYNQNISGMFLSNDFNFTHRFFLNLSGRMEYSSLTDTYAILPRAAANYQINGWVLSAVVGKYQQATDPDYLIRNEKLTMETNWTTLLGMYYQKNKRTYRAELYHKKYDDLPLLTNGIYASDGEGYSRGVDLYLDDSGLLKYVEYTLSYSYNDSKRKYLDYPTKATPGFTTHHNASLLLKYFCPKLRTYCSSGVWNNLICQLVECIKPEECVWIQLLAPTRYGRTVCFCSYHSISGAYLLCRRIHQYRKR